MRIRIKSGYCPAYLTIGKVYSIEHMTKEGKYFILCDFEFENSEYVCISLDNCKHLNDGSWEIVNDV